MVVADAEQREWVKYAHLNHTHHFILVAIETLGTIGTEALGFFKKVAHRIVRVITSPGHSNGVCVVIMRHITTIPCTFNRKVLPGLKVSSKIAHA